ncbi:MAG TPA: SBBP repeat-containing protein [Bryobacteraceae bacterium]|nr:SBBP repeat-containing protein [Bryobacteraceae bacterium]
MRQTLLVAFASLLSLGTAASAETKPHIPVRFEPNLGQANPNVLFLSRDDGFQVFLLRSEIDFFLTDSKGATRAMRMKLGATATPERVTPEERLPGYSNYFIGSDPKAWHSDVPQYGKVRYRSLYPGIDMVYYSREARLEYDFVVAPQADPSRIHLQYDGAFSPRIDAKGDLVLSLPGGTVYQKRPVAYQIANGVRQPVEARYRLSGRRVSFEIGEYDHSRELIVDPVIIGFSSFLGGSHGERGTAITVDAQGNSYITGTTASPDFPNVGAYQRTLMGSDDCFVTKVNSTGTAVLYSTFIGGTQTINGFGADHGMAIKLDGNGNIIVAGTTNSSNFPIVAGSFQTTYGGGFGDGFVLKLNPAGNTLIYSTFIGGSDTDEIYGLGLDAAGNIYVAGDTSSTNFPVMNAYQNRLKGNPNAFVAKLDPTAKFLVYSTYLGGAQQDRAFDIAVDASGNAFVTGEAQSPDFPVLNAYQAVAKSNSDAFVTKFQPNGTIAFSTFLGGTGSDKGFGIALDPQGNYYVAGETASSDFPTTNGAFQTGFGGFSDAFVTKFSAAGGTPVYSTYVGGSLTDGAFALAVDSLGQAHITGRVWSSDFPLANAFQTTFGGGFSDGFVAKLNAAGSALIYSSYLGGRNEDNADNNAGFLGVGGVAIDSNGDAYYTGRTDSENYPTTAGVFQPVFGGRSFSVGDDAAFDAFVIKIGAGTFLGGGGGLQFVPVTPCRIMDSRSPNGPFGGPPLAGGGTRTVSISQSACNIPATALAYSLNATVVPSGPLGYLSIWPAGQAQPVVSTLNSLDGRVVANAAIVPAGSGGAINLFASDTTNVILDINGYFAPASTPNSLSFYSLAPCRVVDTRNPTGPLGGPFMTGNSSRSFPISTSGCGAPSNSLAYSLNITVVPHGSLSYLSSWPTGQAQPVVSTLNSGDGSVVANAAIVPAGTAGGVSIFVTNDTDVIIDINGYFASPGSPAAQSLYTVTPCRVVDTRGGLGQPFGSPSLAAGGTRSFPIPSGACSGIPAGAQAYSLNVTVVPPGPLSYLTAWPTGQAQPVVSTLNSPGGKIVANAAIVPAGTNGGVTVFVTNLTDVILDINAYFAP